MALVFAAAPTAPAADGRPNAADTYRWAAEAARGLEDDWQEVLTDKTRLAFNAPLTDGEKQLFEWSDVIFRSLRAAEGVERCDWNITKDNPFDLPEFEIGSGMRQLMRLAKVRARYQAKNGWETRSVDDLLTVIIAARRRGHDADLINVLVQCSIEGRATEALAEMAPALPDVTQRHLQSRLAKLPEGGVMAEAYGREMDHLTTWLRNVYLTDIDGQTQTIHKTFREFADEWRKMGLEVDDYDPSAVNQLARVAMNDRKRFDASLKELKDLYATTQRLLRLPPNELDAKWESRRDGFDANNVIEVALTPPSVIRNPDIIIKNSRHVEVITLTRLAMLRAGLAYLIDGDDGFKSITEPISGKPFERRDTKTGFDIVAPTVTMPADQKPLVVQFGSVSTDED